MESIEQETKSMQTGLFWDEDEGGLKTFRPSIRVQTEYKDGLDKGLIRESEYPYSEKEEEEIRRLDQKGRIASYYKMINNKLLDEDFIVKNCNLRKIIIKGCDYFNREEGNKIDLTPENPFRMVEGNSIQVAHQLAVKEDIDSKTICLELFADQTYCGCGIFSNWTTQEEQTLRDSNPDIFTYLFVNGHVLTKEIKKNVFRFEYVKDRPYPLSTCDGYLIPGKISSLNLEPLGKGNEIEIMYLFSSMPCMSGEARDFDVYGFKAWATKARKLNGVYVGRKEEKEFFQMGEKLLEMRKKGKIKTNQDFELYIRLFMFDHTIPPTTNESELKNILKHVTNHPNDEQVKKRILNLDKNYEATIRESIRNWIIMAKENGIKYFISGPIGTGTFNNNAYDISRYFAEEFIQYGGDMRYIFSSIKGEEDPNYPIFKKAFQTAWNKFDPDAK